MTNQLYNSSHFNHSLVEPGYFGKTTDNIVVLNNFIELHDLKKIQDFLPKINKWVNTDSDNSSSNSNQKSFDASYWKDRQCSADIIYSLNPEIYFIIEKYIKKMQQYLEDRFRVQLMSRPPVIIKWFEGLSQPAHADKQLLDGSPNFFPNYDINSLFYYNDEFTGGELYYPEFNLDIKPSPGLAVAHPGDINYLHGVRTITSGERWTTPAFYSIEKIL